MHAYQLLIQGDRVNEWKFPRDSTEEFRLATAYESMITFLKNGQLTSSFVKAETIVPELLQKDKSYGTEAVKYEYNHKQYLVMYYKMTVAVRQTNVAIVLCDPATRTVRNLYKTALLPIHEGASSNVDRRSVQQINIKDGELTYYFKDNLESI